MHDNREQTIRLTELKTTISETSFFLQVESEAKALKEKSMNDQFRERFENTLKIIQASIFKKHGIKIYDKACERIGRAKERYPSIQKYYDIQLEKTT